MWPKAETPVRPGLVGFLGWCGCGGLYLTSNTVPKIVGRDHVTYDCGALDAPILKLVDDAKCKSGFICGQIISRGFDQP